MRVFVWGEFMDCMINGHEATLADFCDDDLARSVINSLFSWARASSSDTLPADSKEGWWGDAFADDSGDQFGSKLWLLSRSKMTADGLRRAKAYAEDALAWMVTDGVASSVEVEATSGDSGRLDLAVTVVKPDGKTAEGMRFQDIWS